MSGAYVAKPADAVSYDIPPGWDFDWVFPGPHPPGYEPEYTLSLSAPATMVPGTSVGNITSILKDTVEYVTNEPDAQLFWSAVLSNPGAIGLKFSGGDDYLGSVGQDYSGVGDFWGGEPTFEFDVGLSDVGKTITLTVVSTPFEGHPVSATADITVITEAECEVDLEYEQDLTWGDHPLLREYCIDYVTDGMLVFEEVTGVGEGGWSEYVGTQIAESCGAPRFWMWTQYPEMGVLHWSSVGIISADGIMQAPFAGYGWGGWIETPNTGTDTENWWLIQLVQADRGSDPLETTKAITGMIHWMAYSITTTTVCVSELIESDHCLADIGYTYTKTVTIYDSCTDETTVTITVSEDVCPGEYPVGCNGATPGNPAESETSSDHAESDDPISTGASFFKTWDYYVSLL